MRNAIAVALVAVAVLGLPSGSPTKPSPDVVTVEAARPVVEIIQKMDVSDAVLFRSIYTNAAKIVAHDETGESLINSTDDLRRFHVAMLRYLWNGAGGNSLDKYTGLRESVDEALNETIGDDSRVLLSEVRQKAVQLFSAIGG
jgi:hypothetical protein